MRHLGSLVGFGEGRRGGGIDRRTVKTMLSYSPPPGYRRTKPVRRPMLDGVTGLVDAILEADTDPDVPRKQRHTAQRIFERLRDEKRLLRLQAQLAKVSLLSVDALGYVPLSQTGSELLFDVFSQRYENGATSVTSNLPFQEGTSVFASEHLTGALLDRLTHPVPILEMNGESYRLKQSRSRRRRPSE